MKTITFKDAIKEWRISKGFTQKQMGEELDVSEATIKNWEQGGSRPTEGRIFNQFWAWWQTKI